jgi:hypothetical protein
MGYCSSDMPEQQDPAASYIEGMEEDLMNSPFTREIQVASSLGKPVTIDGVTYDFTGLGDADYQAKYQREMAKAMLALQQKYGPQIIEQRNAELKQSDPEGYAARIDYFNRVMNQLNAPSTAPEGSQAAADLIQKRLDRGTNLEPTLDREVRNRVRGSQVARGNDLGQAAATQEASVLEQAGEKQYSDAQAQAAAFLQSGADPESYVDRDTFQNISDLAAFLSGESPTAQYGSLSSAGKGAVPWQTGGPLPDSTNPNAGAQRIGQNQQIGNYLQNYNQQQVAPWAQTAGLGMQGLNTWAAFQKPQTKTPSTMQT